MAHDNQTNHRKNKSTPVYRILLVLGMIGFGVALYAKYGHLLHLDHLVQHENSLRSWVDAHSGLALGGAFVIYTLVTGGSLPGAVIMTLALGWFFGFWKAFVLVSFASTTGATLAFLISRFLLRDWVQLKFQDRLAGFNDALKREGAFYLFTLRLIPVVPFFVINLVMGLTPLPVRTYWWVSQVGMLPGTAVYVYAGSQFPSLQVLAEKGAKGVLSPQLLLAFAALGLFPLVVKKWMARVRPSNLQTPDQTRP